MTAHLEAAKGEIAKTVLMPGDPPLRAEFIAEKFLTDVKKYNNVRGGMYGFTGKYKGVDISVQGSGMGIPSMGIYSYELFNIYDVENIIRIGSAGSIQEDLKLGGDLVIGLGASTDSNYQKQYNLTGTYSATASYDLIDKTVQTCQTLNKDYTVGNIVCNDSFYCDNHDAALSWQKMGCLALEMESAALYMNAARAGKKALCLLTISDEIITHAKMSSEARQTSFTNMMEVALETAIAL